MKNWIYKGRTIKCLEDIAKHGDIVGFVYKIKNLETNKIYIGKKILHHTRKTKVTKKEKLETNTRRVFKRVTKESDWLNYFGSCKPLLEDVKILGPDKFKREILEFCFSKKHLAYTEIEYQFKEDVLRKDTYNGNILGKYFKKDLYG